MPTTENTLNAASDIQLHRDNTATLELLKSSIKRWAAELSTTENPVTSYFVEVDFDSILQKNRRLFFNKIPTNFSLTIEQVYHLINAGQELLLNNSEYQRFVVDVNSAD